ncbi:hypothetical protein [Marinobacter subterrani]|uniref:hypothetical protein n=1 Tax=Marinobacter subterrani TaxID=1658765 RepID=UPI002352ABAA|nr:hypothetical protein [Marinobacter subterrani]
MAVSHKDASVRPKIIVSELTDYGIQDFQGGYEQLSRMERQLFWRSLLELGCQVVTGQAIQGLTYHRLLSMMTNAFPDMDIDSSVFQQITPTLSFAGDGAGALEPTSEALRSSKPRKGREKSESTPKRGSARNDVAVNSGSGSSQAGAGESPNDNAESATIEEGPGPGPAPKPQRDSRAGGATPFANLLD